MSVLHNSTGVYQSAQAHATRINDTLYPSPNLGKYNKGLFLAYSHVHLKLQVGASLLLTLHSRTEEQPLSRTDVLVTEGRER